MANLNCTIPLSVLMQPPFNLTNGWAVYAVVYVTNIYGTTSSLTYGSGAFINITMSTVPSLPGTAITINSGVNIVITWTAPTSGAPFLNYTIMIGTSYGTWATTSYCNGANATTMANLNCTIP
jgi:hypothetical protein